MNYLSTGNKLLAAGVQAMWPVACFDKQMALLSTEDIKKSIARWVAFSRRRYLSNGDLGNAISFESITYTDALLVDMGFSTHRKGWWKQCLEPFRPGDLGKAWVEYLRRNSSKRIGDHDTDS